MLLRLNITCSLRVQYLLALVFLFSETTVRPQAPLNLVRRPRPGVNHLPTATEKPRLLRKPLRGLFEKLLHTSWLPQNAVPATLACTSQLLQNELVETLSFSV